MKTCTILLALVLSVGVVNVGAEGPTISRSTVPSIGTGMNHQNVKMAGLSAGTAGANVTWDFSALSDSGSVYTETYMNPTGTPYASIFPAANVAVETNDGPASYSYFIIDDSRMEALGVASGSDTDLMTNTKIVTTFPRSYGSVYVDDYVGSIVGTTGIVYTAHDSSVYDGYGTLKLPHGLIYENVARMTSSITYTMADVADTSTKYTIHLKRYTYFSPSYGGGSLLSMQAMILAGIMTRWSSADYVTGFVNDVSDNAIPASLRLCPNPAQDVLIIRSGSQDDLLGTIEVFDNVGQCVLHLDAQGASVYQLPVQSLPTGGFVFRIMVNNKATIQKLCIVH